MDFIESFDLFGVDAKQIPSITGEGAPTSATRGAVGCFYMDTLSGEVYKCIAVNGEEFTWNIFSKSNADGTVGGIQTEADPTVPAWAKEPTKPAYTANEIGAISYTEVQALTEDQKAQARSNIGAGESGFSGSYNDLADKPNIPSALSELSDDSEHRTITDEERESWNSKSNFSGSYNDLTDKPNIGIDGKIQSDWNQSDSNEADYIHNKIPLENGKGTQSIETCASEATGDYSFAGGKDSHADYAQGLVYGLGLRMGKDNQSVVGQYNKVSYDALFVVGSGQDNDTTSNAFEVISADEGACIKIGNTILSEEDLITVIGSAGIIRPIFITQTEQDSMTTPRNVASYAEINRIGGNIACVNSYKRVGTYGVIDAESDASNEAICTDLRIEVGPDGSITLNGYTPEENSGKRPFAIIHLNLGFDIDSNDEEWMLCYEVDTSSNLSKGEIMASIMNNSITQDPSLITLGYAITSVELRVPEATKAENLVIRFLGKRKTSDDENADDELVQIDSFVVPAEVTEIISGISETVEYIDFDSEKIVTESGDIDISQYLTGENIIQIWPTNAIAEGLIEFTGGEATITFTTEARQ